MFDDLRWSFTLASMIVPGITLLALLLRFRFRLDHIGFDKRRWGRLLLLQLFDALVSRRQLLQVLALPNLCLAQLLQYPSEPLLQLTELLFQVGYFFFLPHGVSISDKGQSEQYPVVRVRFIWIHRERFGTGYPD